MSFDSHILSGQIAGALEILGAIPYILSILQRKTKPSRVTWLLWTIAGLIIFTSYFAVGARESLWQPGFAVLGNLIILLLALKYGVGGTSMLDRFCFAGALFSLVLWGASGDPVIGLIMILFVCFFGTVSTMYKSYFQPESEDISTWLLWLLSNIFNLYAVKIWGIGQILYPLYGIFSIGCVVVILLLRRYQFYKVK